eukprot:297331-Rhodomonas_salina.2
MPRSDASDDREQNTTPSQVYGSVGTISINGSVFGLFPHAVKFSLSSRSLKSLMCLWVCCSCQERSCTDSSLLSLSLLGTDMVPHSH